MKNNPLNKAPYVLLPSHCVEQDPKEMRLWMLTDWNSLTLLRLQEASQCAKYWQTWLC